jgi:hypothetical protein
MVGRCAIQQRASTRRRSDQTVDAMGVIGPSGVKRDHLGESVAQRGCDGFTLRLELRD